MRTLKTLLALMGMLVLLGVAILVYLYGDLLQAQLTGHPRTTPYADAHFQFIGDEQRYPNSIWASDINAAGQVVGSILDRPFLWTSTAGLHIFDGYNASAINNAGAIALRDSKGVYIWSREGKIRRLTVPRNMNSVITGLNDAGEAVGELRVDDPLQEYVCRWSRDGQFHILGEGSAEGINNAGVVVARHNNHAAIWRPGAGWSYLSKELTHYGGATSINAAGHVVGYTEKENYGLFWSAKANMRTIPLPGCRLVNPQKINNADQVLLQGCDIHGVWQTYLWSPTHGAQLISPQDGREWRGSALNDAGQIAGTVRDLHTGHERCFLWTP